VKPHVSQGFIDTITRFAVFDGRPYLTEWRELWSMLCSGGNQSSISLLDACERLLFRLDCAVQTAHRAAKSNFGGPVQPLPLLTGAGSVSFTNDNDDVGFGVDGKKKEKSRKKSKNKENEANSSKSSDGKRLGLYNGFAFVLRSPTLGPFPRSHHKVKCRLCRALPVHHLHSAEEELGFASGGGLQSAAGRRHKGRGENKTTPRDVRHILSAEEEITNTSLPVLLSSASKTPGVRFSAIAECEPDHS